MCGYRSIQIFLITPHRADHRGGSMLFALKRKVFSIPRPQLRGVPQSADGATSTAAGVCKATCDYASPPG